jgi:hypothetical protein
MPYLFILILVIFITSCQSSTDNFSANYTLIPSDTLLLPFDSGSKAHSSSINFFYYKNKPTLMIFSELNDNLLFYDLESKKIIRKTTLARQGKNSIGAGKVGACYINEDTLIVSTSSYQLSIIDIEGNLKFKKSLLNPNFLEQPKTGTNFPAILNNDKLLIGTIPYIDTEKIEEFKKAFCLIQIDFKTSSTIPITKYPNSYQKGLYGANFAFNFSYTFNPNNNKIVWSFPIDDSLYVQDTSTNKIESYHCPSKYFSEIAPSKEKNMQDASIYTKFYIQSNSYGPIYYDKYRKVYYRFAERGVDEIRYKEKKWWKYNTIIILNEKFEKIGETEISENATNIQCFVSEKGFFIYEYQEKEEDNFAFIRYELKKI